MRQKRLTDFTNLFLPQDFKKNDKAIVNYFEKNKHQ